MDIDDRWEVGGGQHTEDSGQDGVYVLHEWCMDWTWVVHGRYLGGVWTVCRYGVWMVRGLYLDGTWIVHRWMVRRFYTGGEWIVPGWWVDGRWMMYRYGV